MIVHVYLSLCVCVVCIQVEDKNIGRNCILLLLFNLCTEATKMS